MNQPTAAEVRNAQPRPEVLKRLPDRRVMTPSGRILNLGPVNNDPEWKEFIDELAKDLIGKEPK